MMSTQMYETTQVNDRRTWQCFLFGIVVWFLDLNVVYPLTSVSCHWGWFPFTIAGIPGLRFIQLVVTVSAAILLLIFIYLSWRNWHPFQRKPQLPMTQTEADRRPLIAYVVMLLNCLFLLFVLASAVSIVTLTPCVSGGG